MKIECIQTGPFGVNTFIYSVYENYVFVVDCAACELTGDKNIVVDFLKENGLVPIAFLLTHGHFDHITGSSVLKQFYPNVPLACHEKDAMYVGQNAFELQLPSLQVINCESLAPSLKNLPNVDKTFCGGETFDIFLDKQKIPVEVVDALKNWKIIHTPGHTQGSSCFYNEKEKILISGDTLFYHSWGRTDLEGGSEVEMKKNLLLLKKIISNNAKVFPGHDFYGFLYGENGI